MTKYKAKEEADDTVHFNIVPIPRAPTMLSQPGDIVTFTIPGRESRTPR
jgi:hypothetical protein